MTPDPPHTPSRPPARTPAGPTPARPDPAQRLAAEGAAPDEVLNGQGAQDLDARAALLLPTQLLDPAETIILLLKPSPLFILLSPLKQLVIVILITGIAGTLANLLHESDLDTRITLGGLVVVAGRIFWETLEWFNRTYVLTDRRVIRVTGVLRISIFEARLSKIQNTEVFLSMRERLFNLGTLGFSTAGTGTIDAFWRMVANPLDVHRTVIHTLKRYSN